jgi:hypothetical protein
MTGSKKKLRADKLTPITVAVDGPTTSSASEIENEPKPTAPAAASKKL